RFYHQQLSSLGFRDVIRVTEEDTRYRGWLVRRVCGFLAVWDWKVPADTPRDLPSRICCSKRVRDVTTGWSRGSSGDSESHWPWKEEILKILAEIQAPLSLLMLRLCNWALLKLLNCLFLNVQLHRGQLEMVLRARKTVGISESRSRPCVSLPACWMLSLGFSCSPTCRWFFSPHTNPRWMGCSCPSSSSPRGWGCPG
uniref:Uncharacterized protein n=1 Tax=Athene cunicularia TaxID=194338 RepID=A0A663NDW8_ATHCN